MIKQWVIQTSNLVTRICKIIKKGSMIVEIDIIIYTWIVERGLLLPLLNLVHYFKGLVYFLIGINLQIIGFVVISK